MQVLRTVRAAPPLPPLATTPHHSLRSSAFLSTAAPLSLLPNLSISVSRPPSTVIRMGGGPRTFPGGVSKWQWKRMQSKKAKQLLKARLARERHIYEMRKRAELKAAVSDLERPWDLLHLPSPATSTLFSVAADQQLKVLADRFQKPGGFDMWTENDGPQIFLSPDEGLPTARFFPKGVVHSIRPYERIDPDPNGAQGSDSDVVPNPDDNKAGIVNRKNGHRKRIPPSTSRDDPKMEANANRSDSRRGGVSRMDGDRKGVDRKSVDSRHGNTSINMRRDGGKRTGRGMNPGRSRLPNSEDVYDMSMQGDGSYGFSGNDEKKMIKSKEFHR